MIERAEVLLLTHDTADPRGPSCFTYHRRESVLVRLQDADGFVGWGETYLRPGTVESLHELSALTVGRDPMAATARWNEAVANGQDWYAASALSIAIDDLRGRRLGIPSYDLHGGAVRDRVRAYASSGGYGPDLDPEVSWPEEVAQHAEAGFTAVKLRIGRFEPARELPILERVRAEAGDELELMVDGNGAYGFGQAVRVGRALEDLRFRWFEEPLARMQHGVWYTAAYERLTAALDIPVAAAEGLETPSAFQEFLARAGADIVQPDVSSCGGIGAGRFVAQLAELHGCTCVPHFWGGVVMLAATLQLHAVLPDPTEVPGMESPLLELDVFENPMRTDLTAEPFLPDGDGYVAIPSGPGLGIELDEERVRAMASVTQVTDRRVIR